MALQVDVFTTSGKSIGTFALGISDTVKDLKKLIEKKIKLSEERQSIRCAPKGGKDEKNTTHINSLKLESNKIYLKDLGPQIKWVNVFFWEYFGPIFLYGLLFALPYCFYGIKNNKTCQDENQLKHPLNSFPFYTLNKLCNGGNKLCYNIECTTYIAAILWTIHYGKRILETFFVHRFSHGTMPIFNLFKNCSYYWGFALYIAYHINHPLHTSPPRIIFHLGCIIFVLCEIGNLSIHLLLRDLRPAGTNIRKIPVPNANPFTKLFNYVSCPNYTYEFGSWIGFTLLTGCLPVFVFALAGLGQMTIWAIGKHKKYNSEFSNYPKKRKAILPFLI